MAMGCFAGFRGLPGYSACARHGEIRWSPHGAAEPWGPAANVAMQQTESYRKTLFYVKYIPHLGMQKIVRRETLVSAGKICLDAVGLGEESRPLRARKSRGPARASQSSRQARTVRRTSKAGGGLSSAAAFPIGSRLRPGSGRKRPCGRRIQRGSRAKGPGGGRHCCWRRHRSAGLGCCGFACRLLFLLGLLFRGLLFFARYPS